MASTSAAVMNRSVSRSVAIGLGKVYGSFTPRDPTTGVQRAGYPPTRQIRVRSTMEPTHSKSGDPVGVWALHADEMQYKLDHGFNALLDHLDEAKVSELLEADRPSCVPRRRRGLFRR